MIKKLGLLAMATVTIGALGLAWRQRALAGQLADELERARQSPPPKCDHSFEALGQAVSSALAAKREVVKPADEGDAEESKFEDLSPDVQAKWFDAADAFGRGSRDALGELVSKLHMTADQQARLHEGIEQMNKRIAAALDRLIALTTQPEPVTSRAVIDAVADGLNAIRETDDGFRAALDNSQRDELARVGFDMAGQIDGSILMTRVIAFAVAKGSSDAGSANDPSPVRFDTDD
jgi:hypothetical protein